MLMSHSPCFNWKFFMILFYKILKLILKAAIISLEIYLYLKNNNSVKHVQNVLLNVLFLYFNLCKFAKFLMSFLKGQVSFLQVLHQSSMPSNITLMRFFSSNIINFGQRSQLKSTFFRFSSSQVKIRQIPDVNF